VCVHVCMCMCMCEGVREDLKNEGSIIQRRDKTLYAALVEIFSV